MPRHNTQSGLTLVELLIWIALVAMIMAAIAGIFSTSIKAWLYGDSQYDVQQTARMVTNSMSQDLRYGTNYKILSSYSNAQANQAFSFTSRKDAIVYTYYIDKTDRHLYRSPGYKSTSPELVPGQTTRHIQDIQITAPTEEVCFSLTGTSSINLSFLITDTQRIQSYIVRTTVSDMAIFLK